MVTVIRLGLALDANTCVEFASQVKSSQVTSSHVKSGHTPVEGAGGFMGELTRGANACIRGGRRSLGVRKSHGEC